LRGSWWTNAWLSEATECKSGDAGKTAKKVFQSLLGLILCCYFILVSVAAVYFNWQYARTHGFVAWIFLGEITSTAKALVWPYFVFLDGERSQIRNASRSRSEEIPLNDDELKGLSNAIAGLTQTGELSDQDIRQVRTILSDYFHRTGAKLSKAQYEENLGFLRAITEYKYELGRSALLSWDNGRVITTPEFDSLSNALREAIPDAQLREDRNMIEVASRHQPYIDASDGKRYEFSREGLAAGHEKKTRQRAAFERLTTSVIDLLG
jgi:hypothetical protein